MTMTTSRRVASSPASASATPAPSQAEAEAVAVCPFDGESCLSKTSAIKIAEKILKSSQKLAESIQFSTNSH